MPTFCEPFRKAACTRIDCTSAFAIGRAAMNALVAYATRTAGQMYTLCSLRLRTSLRSWRVVRCYVSKPRRTA